MLARADEISQELVKKHHAEISEWYDFCIGLYYYGKSCRVRWWFLSTFITYLRAPQQANIQAPPHSEVCSSEHHE